jgi:hypothetical protein
MSTVYVIGIDFGTSNSCVTYATYEEDSSGKLDPRPVSPPEPVPFESRQTVPTAVFEGDDDGEEPLYGEAAEEKAAFCPELTHTGFKMKLGQPGDAGREAFRRAKAFLSYVRTRVAEFVPLDQEAKSFRVETIIGHPVQWSADQREETRRAAEEAGFPNVQLEDESLAALYTHLCEDGAKFEPESGSRVMMIDMGGGTTDFAFLQIPPSPEQRPVSRPVDPAPVVQPWREGRSAYGGRDLDEVLLEHFAKDWEPEWVQQHRTFLLREVRHFKEAFSNNVRQGRHRHETMWLIGDKVCNVSLTRDEFEHLAGDYIAHLEALVRAALALANLATHQIATVILTGGHSRWYFVDHTLRTIFPHMSRQQCTLLRHSHPEQSVARGLGFVPMVRSDGSKILAPVRKSAHSIWVHVPYGSRVMKPSAHGLENVRPKDRGAVWDEPVLILPRGHQLPFSMPKPLRIAVNKLGLDVKEATVRIQFYSSAGGNVRVPLYERIARFERTFWEGLWKRFGAKLPWGKGTDEDQFELLITCSVDENEILTAEVVIVRYFRGREAAVQRQKLRTHSDLEQEGSTGRRGEGAAGRTPQTAKHGARGANEAASVA